MVTITVVTQTRARSETTLCATIRMKTAAGIVSLLHPALYAALVWVNVILRRHVLEAVLTVPKTRPEKTVQVVAMVYNVQVDNVLLVINSARPLWAATLKATIRMPVITATA